MKNNKYIIPAKRSYKNEVFIEERKIVPKVQPKANKSSLEKKGIYIPPHKRDNSLNEDTDLKYTNHGLLRLKQREISAGNIKKILETGEQLSSGRNSSSYIDKDTQIVLGQDKKVITLIENKRNTNFNLLNYSKSKIAELEKKVKKNNDYAMCELAELYLRRDLESYNAQKAKGLFLKAAKMKNSHAMCKLSQLYNEGVAGSVDKERASYWIEQAAHYGNKFALAIVGQRYFLKYLQIKDLEGISTEEKNMTLKKAVNFLEHSADKGSTRAMWHLAQIYKKGWLGEEKIDRGIEILAKAAKLGSPNSLYSLWELVLKSEFNTDFFEEILATASALIIKTSSDIAIEIGVAQITKRLGTNPKRGLDMLEQVASCKENEEAIKLVAKYYRDGIEGILKSDKEIAIYWFHQLEELYKEAANQGNIDAIWNLGELYLKGKLGKIDLEKAEAQFMRCAKENDVDAMYSLGMLYINGRLSDKDPNTGIYLVQQAINIWQAKALEGDLEAAIVIGKIYYDGDMGACSYEEAFKWFSFAAKTDEEGENAKSAEAMLFLAKLHSNDKSGYKNLSLAIEWIEMFLNCSSSLHIKEKEQEILIFLNELILKEKINIPLNVTNTLKKHLGEFTLLSTKDNDAKGKEDIEASLKIAEERYQLGLEYLKGDNREKDILFAAYWFRKAGNKGNLKANLELAKMYDNGLLGEKVQIVAKKLYLNCDSFRYETSETINNTPISLKVQIDEDQASILGEHIN